MKHSQTSAASLLAMVHPQDLEYLKEGFASLKPGIFKNNVEFRMQLPGRKECFLRLSLIYTDQHLQSEEHTLTGYLEDYTADKEHEDTLNEYSNKKNAVLNILSHDLAGPLGSIQNLSALLSRKTKLLEDQEVAKWVSLIEKISKKSIHLIQEFVKQEFIESAGAALLKKRTDLVLALNTMLQEYQQSENDLNLNFEFKLNTEPIFVEIDEAKFLQAINNLISNAIKFTPDGGTITIVLEEKEDLVAIVVADTGIGIPKKFHKGLFDKFNNARRTGLKGEPSVGLGMSIIKTIVDWHEGKIWFESEENKGSKFYIEIKKSN
ncbi:MAG: sensor histidine kinase [Janthinobacterium lividum]